MLSLEYLIILTISLVLIFITIKVLFDAVIIYRKYKDINIVLKLSDVLNYLDSQRGILIGNKEVKLFLTEDITLEKEFDYLKISYHNFSRKIKFHCNLSLNPIKCKNKIIISYDGKGNCMLTCN